MYLLLPESQISWKNKIINMKLLKTFLSIILFVATTLQIKAQEKFTTYDNTYAEKSFEIQISEKDVLIEVMSLDGMHKEGGIFFAQKNLQDFLKALTEAKLKYEEWIKTAKENNVKELDKTMAIKSKVGGYFLYGNKWNFQHSVYLKFDFKIAESNNETNYLLIIRTGELQSSSNEFIKVDGFALVFSSPKEIEDLTTAISKEKITEFLNKPKKDALFKD